uniref:CCHC-type domain-containing protein n=1 Tax=Vitis vinifera TaxID=29760 RepID=F6H5P7_VITVI
MTLDKSKSPPQAKRLRSSDRASYRDAPYPKDSRVHRQDYLCNKCKRPGHFARDCPNVTVCNNCGLPGHIAAECNSTTICWNCKESRHLASQCPNDPVCHMCGKMGHLARDCSCPGLLAHDARLCNNCYKPGQVYLLMFNHVVHRDSLHINYGGANEIIKNNFGNIKYEGDIDGGGSASRNFIGTNWGFSSTGDFMDDDSDDEDKYIESNSSVLSMNHSVLYMTARKVPLSLTYFGFCLKNGDYNVCLHFAEIEFTDEEAYSKLGRRIFNIYIQGKLVWEDFNIMEKANGIAGAAIWGSSPSIDVRRNLVYVATGNLYSAPLSIRECQEQQNNQTVPTQPDQCIEPDNHSNSILAIDLDSDKIKWYRQLGGYDAWFLACNNLSTPNCPPGPNPDADFGEAPMMLSIYVNGTMRDIVIAVQKSGFVWALDRNNGSLIWATVSPIFT